MGQGNCWVGTRRAILTLGVCPGMSRQDSMDLKRHLFTDPASKGNALFQMYMLKHAETAYWPI